MAKNTYKVIAVERFSGDNIDTMTFTNFVKAEKQAKDFIRYSNIERVDIFKNGTLYEFIGREYNSCAAMRIKDGKVTMIRL